MLAQSPTTSLPTQNSKMNHPQQTQTTAMPPHRRNLAQPHQDPATSSLEPTTKKHSKSSTLLSQDLGPNIQSIIKPFRNFYTAQQNALNNPKSSTFVPKPQIETNFQVKPISDSSIQDKPMSKSIHHSRRATSEIEKQKIKPPIFLHKTQIETAFQAKPISVSSIQDKPMSKSIHQSRKSTLEIEKQKLRASVTRVSDKDPTFLPKSQIETSFQAKHIYASSIEGKPMSKSSRPSRQTTVEIEKQKLRASINGHFDKPHDFKIEFLKKMPKEERLKEETNVSLSKSQDSGLKVAYRGELVDVKRPSFSLMTGGRRRSFCNSQAELADFLSCNGVKIVSVDMPPFMQIHAVDCARKTCDSLEKFTSKTLAFTLKKEFDGAYGPAWHCIVGSSFGSFVTHSVGGFMYFSMDHKIYILLFKTTVQRAH